MGLGRIGFNSDEAVYASQAASIAGIDQYKTLFPVFRAHPLLFQTLLSILFAGGANDVAARALAAIFGVATVGITYLIGSRMYGHRVGLLAAAVLAVMPYHVVVSRQVLLDGPMVFFATATLYCGVRYAQDRVSVRWMFATMGMMGLTFLAKETSVLLLVAFVMYLFISPRPALVMNSEGPARLSFLQNVRIQPKRYLLHAATVAAAVALLLVLMAVLPVSIALSGRKSTGQNYLAWQLFRRSNHSLSFYATEVPLALGIIVVVFALIAVVVMAVGAVRHRALGSAEKLLICWAVVPIIGFEIYPVKGYQYLLPIAPVVAVFAARQILQAPALSLGRFDVSRRTVQSLLAAIAIISLVWPTWIHIHPTPGTTFVAGSGGVPEGREAGKFIDANLPEGAQLLTVGPSMANIIMYYGHRRTYGLSVSPNPLNRNPSYTALDNPDGVLRRGEVQYIVWDAYSASRSPHFAGQLMTYVRKFKAEMIQSFSVSARSKHGSPVEVVRIYEVKTR